MQDRHNTVVLNLHTIVDVFLWPTPFGYTLPGSDKEDFLFYWRKIYFGTNKCTSNIVFSSAPRKGALSSDWRPWGREDESRTWH
jgi:hypothetical protein